VAEDFVIATGVTTTVRDLTTMAFAEAGVEVEFSGTGENEVGTITQNNSNNSSLKIGQELVKVDKGYFRLAEVDVLLGDSSKAFQKLGWKPKYDLKSTVAEMVKSDMAKV
jgi:GDPmannose 4,6-dehydratase